VLCLAGYWTLLTYLPCELPEYEQRYIKFNSSTTLTDNFVDSITVIEWHKTKATFPARFTLSHKIHWHDISILLEVFLQVIFFNAILNTADKDLLHCQMYLRSRRILSVNTYSLKWSSCRKQSHTTHNSSCNYHWVTFTVLFSPFIYVNCTAMQILGCMM